MAEGTDPYPYRHMRRPGSPGKRKGARPKKTERPALSRSCQVPRAGLSALIVLGLAGFFLGRAVLLGELMPFGPALVAATVRCRRKAAPLVTLAVLAGLATQAPASSLPAYLLAALLVFVLLNLLPAGMPRPWLVVPGVTAAAVLIVRTAFLAFAAPSTYAYITALFEAIFIAILTQLFVVALMPLLNMENPRPLSAEELFSLLLLLAGFITGAGSYTWWLLSLRGSLSRFFVLIAAYLGGPGLGAAVGALTGVIPGLTLGTSHGLINAYAFAGLVAGLCAGFGRLGPAFGFLLGNIVLSIYTSNFTGFTAALAETGAAMLLYLVFPENLVATMRVYLAKILPADEPHPEEDRAQTFLARRVQGWADIFHELARAFEEVSASAPAPIDTRLQSIIDQVAATVCHGCSLHQTCWEKEFYRTFQSLRDLVFDTENLGPGKWQVPEETRRRCPRHRELGIAVLASYTTSRLQLGWDRKLQQERDIVAVQMEAMAGMLDSLSTRVRETEWNPPPLPAGMAEQWKKKGVTVLSLTMEGTGGNWAEAVAELSPCPLKTNCWQSLAGFLQETFELRFFPATRQCLYQEGERTCLVRLYPDPRYSLSLGAAIRARDGSDISGDSFAVWPLPDGRIALVLSDGMGTGPAAARESKATTRLLADLLQAGFSPEVAVRTVNAVLLMEKPEESFTTIDLAIVDLYGGEASFIKVGAPPSLVGRGKRVGIIQSSSLPAGIIHDISVPISTRRLSPGDYLVLATDGVHDAHPDGKQDFWLAGLLQEIAEMHPRELADLVLNLASQHPPRDDQAVLVARLEEN